MAHTPNHDVPLRHVRTLLTAKRYGAAADALYRQSGTLFSDAHGLSTVRKLLERFPPEYVERDSRLLYMQGMAHLGEGAYAAAITVLERARFLAWSRDHDGQLALRCCLAIARAYQSQEQFKLALLYLTEECDTILERSDTVAPGELGALHLRRAEVTLDLGQLAESDEHARKALTIYRQIGDIGGQFETVMFLAAIAQQRGDLESFAARIEQGHNYQSATPLGSRAQLQLLNYECHLHWYRGELAEALTLAHRLQALADEADGNLQQVFARLLLANLNRELRQWEEARGWYQETRRLATGRRLSRFTLWIDAHEAWLYLLRRDLPAAKPLLDRALGLADRGQTMSVQVFLAVWYWTSGQVATAIRLLKESVSHYAKSGDELTVCNLQLLLAGAALTTGDMVSARAWITTAFTWLRGRRVYYVPLWWHPGLILRAAAFALEEGIFLEVAEQLLAHLGDRAIEHLSERLREPALPVAAQQHIFHFVESRPEEQRARALRPGSTLAYRVVEQLVQQGVFASDRLPALLRRLTTAAVRLTPNWTLTAVFGLYLAGYTRNEIATQLHCSIPTVRNYINTIYHIFDLPQGRIRGQKARRAQLQERARHEGLIV